MSTALKERLRSARSVVVLTGAGVSAESGIPTFRGPGGLWRQFRAEDLATPEAFEKDPKLVWEWYDWRRQLIAAAKPNLAHRALAQMEQHFPHFLLVTQNIDGLHRRAGSERLVELHGCIWRVRCLAEGNVSENHQVPLPELPPRCPCGSLLRPDVVWFGEPLPPEALTLAWNATRSCDIFFSVGTSALVQPAASLPIMAKEEGAFVVEVNPAQTPSTPFVDAYLQGPAGEILPHILQISKGIN
jgi:NAD-dependent deacetylase